MSRKISGYTRGVNEILTADIEIFMTITLTMTPEELSELESKLFSQFKSGRPLLGID
ncbi:MAG: hypothetical protein ACI9XB_000697 [Gammaproteobacteria bacterium]|jgi:hypothetical protein